MSDELDGERLKLDEKKALSEIALARERFELDRTKILNEIASDRQRLIQEWNKSSREENLLRSNLGVFMPAAIAILGIALSAGQIWVAFINTDHESRQRKRENRFSEEEKQREFNFQEKKDLRDFVDKHYTKLNSSDREIQRSWVNLMLDTYDPEILAPVLDNLASRSFGPQREILNQAKNDLAWSSQPPEKGYCYQEYRIQLPHIGEPAAYCHFSKSNCEKARPTTASACALIDPSLAGWTPSPKGLFGSWYELGLPKPLGPPFPPLKGPPSLRNEGNGQPQIQAPKSPAQ